MPAEDIDSLRTKLAAETAARERLERELAQERGISEGRRAALEQKAEECRAEWRRAENAEAHLLLAREQRDAAEARAKELEADLAAWQRGFDEHEVALGSAQRDVKELEAKLAAAQGAIEGADLSALEPREQPAGAYALRQAARAVAALSPSPAPAVSREEYQAVSDAVALQVAASRMDASPAPGNCEVCNLTLKQCAEWKATGKFACCPDCVHGTAAWIDPNCGCERSPDVPRGTPCPMHPVRTFELERDGCEACFDDWLRSCGVVKADGSFDTEQARKELHDYHFMLGEVPKVYTAVTGGRLSKPNYYAASVIGVAKEHAQAEADEQVKEALADVPTFEQAIAFVERCQVPDKAALVGYMRAELSRLATSQRDDQQDREMARELEEDAAGAPESFGATLADLHWAMTKLDLVRRVVEVAKALRSKRLVCHESEGAGCVPDCMGCAFEEAVRALPAPDGGRSDGNGGGT